MPNSFNDIYVEKLQRGLETHFDFAALTNWMQANAQGIDYKGGKYVVMREIEVDGMGNYSRSLGYPRGAITGAPKQYELTQDRGREFVIDVADHDELGFVVTAASVMREFQANHVVPEIDSYRMSTIFKVIDEESDNHNTDAIDPDTITDLLLEDLAEMQDKSTERLIVIMSGLTQRLLGTDFMRTLEYQSFGGAFRTKVRSLDGTPIMIMPSSRLKTAYDFLDGVTEGEEAGGIEPDVAADDIRWLIIPQRAPIAVGKIDKVRVFTPEEYQDMHAWKVDYRIYHDLWLPVKMAEKSLVRTGDITSGT